ncbi:MAG: rhomboid family intramembrane serine protease [Clostridium sp.]|nr:rhomboid family intramembrane serine protease [Clostridium sp.]
MVYEQLERLLIEQGFDKVPSNLPEFSFFFRRENTYVNVLHIIDYKQELYITEDQYTHIKEKIQDFFQGKGSVEVHILSLIICADTAKAKQLCGSDAFCWIIDAAQNRLLIHENQAADFYGMKDILENFLYDISTAADMEKEDYAGSAPDYQRDWSAVKNAFQCYRVNVLLVIINAILFMICTFTGDLLYNVGAFSVRNLIEDREWYRVLTSMFLHADIGHLVSNMLILYYIGNVVEKQVGHIPYIIIYFLSGFIGNVFSAGYEMMTGYYTSSIGASGAVFGIEGALLLLALLHKGKLADVTTGRIVFSLAFSLYCGFTDRYVNNAAHVGGVIAGFLAAGIFWLLTPGIRQEKRGLL